MIQNKNIFITGNSSGLGKSITEKLSLKNKIYSISKSKLNNPNINVRHYVVNFKNSNNLKKKLKNFKNLKSIDYLILNAGILGKIKLAKDINLKELETGFKINVLSNKIIIDFFLQNKTKIKNIIAISSGAAVSAKDGWLNYCGSKSYFKMLIDTYALENSKINFVNLAPGLIMTKMQKQIFNTQNKRIKSIKVFKTLYKNNSIENSDIIADKIINFLKKIRTFKKKGSFIDLRKFS